MLADALVRLGWLYPRLPFCDPTPSPQVGFSVLVVRFSIGGEAPIAAEIHPCTVHHNRGIIMFKKNRLVDFRVVRMGVSKEQVLVHYGPLEQMKRSGNSLSGCCPVHKDTNPTQFLVSISPRTGSSAPAWALRSSTIRLGFLNVVLRSAQTRSAHKFDKVR